MPGTGRADYSNPAGDMADSLAALEDTIVTVASDKYLGISIRDATVKAPVDIQNVQPPWVEEIDLDGDAAAAADRLAELDKGGFSVINIDCDNDTTAVVFVTEGSMDGSTNWRTIDTSGSLQTYQAQITTGYRYVRTTAAKSGNAGDLVRILIASALA